MFDRSKLNHWLTRLLSSRRAALISAAALLAISLQVFAASYFNEETGLYEFQDGEVILAEEVNGNFARLNDLVPIGAVVPWNKTPRNVEGEIVVTLELPSGWLECNGQMVDDISSTSWLKSFTKKMAFKETGS